MNYVLKTSSNKVDADLMLTHSIRAEETKNRKTEKPKNEIFRPYSGRFTIAEETVVCHGVLTLETSRKTALMPAPPAC